MKTAALIGAVFVAILAASSCDVKVSTAKLSDIRACTELKSGLCPRDTKTFSKTTPLIFVATRLNNAPDETDVTFAWRYLEGAGQDIDSVTVTAKNGENTASSSLPMPADGWPAGRYEVVVSLDTENSKPVHKPFSIE